MMNLRDLLGPLAARIRVLNPDLPFKGERFAQLQEGNAPVQLTKDKDYGYAEFEWSTEREWFRNENLFKPGLQKWHVKALENYSLLACYPEEARKKSLALIRKSEDRAAEAHILLALLASSHEEALQEFRNAKAIAQEVVNWNHEAARTALTQHDYWDNPGLRPLQRAQIGIALTLCKLGRWQESKEAYEVLVEEMDRGSPKSYSSYINWRYHYPLVLMHLDDYQGALKFMEAQKDCFLLQSTQLTWAWNISLCQLKLRKLKGIDGRYWDSDLPQQSQHIQESSIGANVRMAQSNIHLWKLLASHKPDSGRTPLEIPNAEIPVMLASTESEEQAYVYWNRHRALWEKNPDAIEAVVRIRNRFLVSVLFQTDDKGMAFTTAHVHAPISVKSETKVLPLLNQWLDEGSDLSSVPGIDTITNLVTAKGVPTPSLAKYLVELSRHHYELNEVNQMGLTPLNVACYYARNGPGGGAVISVLLQSGIDPWVVPPRGQLSPAEMAANQGNWLAIKTILNHSGRPKPDQLSKLFLHMIGSSVFLCRTGRHPNCQRCSHDQAHDPDVSFEKSVECLVAYGLTPRHAVDQGLNSMVMMMMDLDPAYIKSHPLHRLLTTRYKQKDRFASQYTQPDPYPEVTPLKCCHHCGGCLSTKLCSRCKQRVFCSRYCQVRDWPTHKPHCKKV